MARPIEGIPPFNKKAWAWLMGYLKRARPDPAKLHEPPPRVLPLKRD